MVGHISYPLDTRRCCDVESTSLTLIQRRSNVVCLVGILTYKHRIQTFEPENVTSKSNGGSSRYSIFSCAVRKLKKSVCFFETSIPRADNESVIALLIRRFEHKLLYRKKSSVLL